MDIQTNGMIEKFKLNIPHDKSTRTREESLPVPNGSPQNLSSGEEIPEKEKKPLLIRPEVEGEEPHVFPPLPM